MVKKSFLVLIVLLFTFTTLFANSAVYKQADDLFWSDRYEEGKSYIEGELKKTTNPTERSELLWRLSRVTLGIGDEMKVQGASKDELFAIFEEGEAQANEAIKSAPLAWAYVYRASNIGRWGETKGPLNSLAKAKGMRDDFAYVIDTLGVLDNDTAWYVLSQLYFQLPGWPISFGDIDTAISYSRKAIDSIPQERLLPGHFKSLAKMLWKRDLSASKRQSKIQSIEKEWKKSHKSSLDKYGYYEGANGVNAVPFYSPVALNKMSDRQEAQMVLAYAIAKYEVWPFHSRSDKRNYADMKALMQEWGF
ncbi:MAG: hypothetical protein WC207_06730 [Sphaerochaetaceae bacterium]|jgi:hypothetical protein